MKDVPAGDNPNHRSQGVARDMLDCLAKLYDAAKPQRPESVIPRRQLGFGGTPAAPSSGSISQSSTDSDSGLASGSPSRAGSSPGSAIAGSPTIFAPGTPGMISAIAGVITTSASDS